MTALTAFTANEQASAAGFEVAGPSIATAAPEVATVNLADEALKDLGTWGGQCFNWVKGVVDRATPYTMGWGYRDGYLVAGAVEVTLASAVRGDIIQLANDAITSPNVTYGGLHSSIVLENLGGGRFDVVDSNQDWDEVVRLRPGYEPLEAAARYLGISVRVYRFPGASAVDAPPPDSTQIEAGAQGVVNAGGDCLRLRDAPGLSGTRLDCLPDGSVVTITGAAQTVDGLQWLPVSSALGDGWVAAIYIAGAPASLPPQQLIANTPSDETAGGTTAPAPAIEGDGYTLPVPPEGGLTRGLAGTNDPTVFVEAQGFPVQTLSVFDVAMQRYLTFVPGAPSHINTLTSATLDPDDVVTVKRAQTGAAVAVTPSVVAINGPQALLEPPAGGLTQGIAGTSEVEALIAAQGFAVQTLFAWDVATQTFLSYIPGAPALVNTLNAANLKPEMVVVIRRGTGSAESPAGGAPASETGAPEAETTVAETPPSTDQREATITYYYCQQGANPAGIGDGGGWCGGMASGKTVYEGAASCAAAYMGQQFRILGDPTERTYTCEDTGGGVNGEHRDIFFQNSDDGYAWWLTVGNVATIEIIG